MKLIVKFLAVAFAIVLATQCASAYSIDCFNFTLESGKEVTSEALMQQITTDKIKSVEVYNVGFGKEKANPNSYNGLLLPYNDNYGESSIRIHFNGMQKISSVKIKCSAYTNLFLLNGAEMDSNEKNTEFTITLDKTLSVIDICSRRNVGKESSQVRISQIYIYPESSTDDKPEPSTAELTYSNFVRPLQGRVYVNPGQTLSAVSQNADSIKVLYENKEIASSAESVVNFYPISSGKYTILASNSIGSATPSEYDIVVSNTYPAYGSIVTSANTVEDGHYYLICGRPLNRSGAYLSLEPSKSYFCNLFNDMTNCFVRDSLLVVKAVKDGEKWRFLTSDDGVTGLCKKTYATTYIPTIGEASPVELEIVESGGCYLKMDDRYFCFKPSGNVQIDEVDRRNTFSTLLLALDQTLPQGANVSVNFESKEVGDTTYAVGRVNITGLIKQSDDNYQLYCGGMLLGNLVDGSIDTYLPAADYGELSLVRKVNGYVQGVATLKQNPWEGICNDVLTKSTTSNNRLHYNSEKQALVLYLPLELETDFSYTAEVKCDDYPNATIVEEYGCPVVYIPDYIKNFNWDDRANYKYSPIEIEVTPLIKVAEPQTAKSTAVDKTGYMRGKTTKLSYEFDYSEVSSVSSVKRDSLEASYYTVDGRLITGTPTLPGIYIKRNGNEASKILVK